MTTPLEPPLTPEQQLAEVANAGGDLVAAAFAYVATCATWNVAGGLSDA